MELEKPPGDARPVSVAEPSPAAAEGCLTVAIRVPLRIVMLVLVVPVRMVWDALVVTGRFLGRTVFRPLGRAVGWLARALFVLPLVGLWRYVVVPLARAVGWLGTVLLVRPARWLYRWVLTPAGHALLWVCTRLVLPAGAAVGAAVAWLARVLVALPAGWFYRWVLTPVGHVLARCGRGLAWCAGGVAWCVRTVVVGIGTALYRTGRVLLVLPALALWRWVLAPVGRFLAVLGREIADAVGHAWRIAGRVSLAVGRFLATLFRWLFVDPVRWVYRTLLTPVGHVLRDHVLRPVAETARGAGQAVRQAFAAARASVRQARADVRRALFGAPRPAVPVDRREPSGDGARTLGSSTTALTKD
ncbi:hypothetical protein [Streptomyces sp. CRN 30]|uniref:hypothetical protein n=1 Tax=Streptomyces sp. CRN 30 TaxID=3075613 RepID=UPI002A7EEA4E|nr:hypothetical protein [Streptomyces sp. CRN 30]